MLVAALSATARRRRGHQRHRRQHAGRPRGRPGRLAGASAPRCSRSTRATSAGSSKRPTRRWSYCSTCRATSSTGSPRSGCWSTGGGRPSAGRSATGPTGRGHRGGGQRRRPHGGLGGRGRPEVRWVGAGQVWHDDAVGCPACGGGIAFDADGGWACDRCDFARPERFAWLEGADLVAAGGRASPARHLRSRASSTGPTPPWRPWPPRPWPRRTTGRSAVAVALARVAAVDQVAGRFSTVRRTAVPSGCCWPRTRPGGPPSSTSWTRRAPGRRWCSRSMPGWPTASTPAGSGTCPSSGWPAARWWPPATGVWTSPSASATPRWTTDGGRPARPRWTRPPRRRSVTGPGRGTGRHRSSSWATTPPSPPAEPAVSAAGAAPSLTVVVVYPDLLGTYGDGGNGPGPGPTGRLAGHRRHARPAPSDRPLPRADLYCVGGGEDGPQVRAATALIAEGTLAGAVGRRGGGAGGVRRLPAGRPQLPRRRRPAPPGPGPARRRPPGRGTGAGRWGSWWPSHRRGPPGGSTARRCRADRLREPRRCHHLGPDARPLARVVSGVGNGAGDGTEGAWSGRVVGTYLHGPVLARNAALADLLLGWALSPSGGGRAPAPLDDAEEDGPPGRAAGGGLRRPRGAGATGRPLSRRRQLDRQVVLAPGRLGRARRRFRRHRVVPGQPARPPPGGADVEGQGRHQHRPHEEGVEQHARRPR